MNKQQVYDEGIKPLLGSIIELCRAHGIAMVCAFAIPTEDRPKLRATAATLDGDRFFPDDLNAALFALHPNANALCIPTPYNPTVILPGEAG